MVDSLKSTPSKKIQIESWIYGAGSVIATYILASIFIFIIFPCMSSSECDEVWGFIFPFAILSFIFYQLLFYLYKKYEKFRFISPAGFLLMAYYLFRASSSIYSLFSRGINKSISGILVIFCILAFIVLMFLAFINRNKK